ncbi:MAG TPA: hypothetical protein PKL97_00335 [Candidatus Omnitrophota bacterium]|nr:hypothetical protein [Candidatus Omnitrophota bacterium]
MKKSVLISIFLLSVFPLLLSANISFAQTEESLAPATEAAQPAQAPEETDYSFGTVKQVSPTEITVSEYDYETDNDVDVVYALDPKLELKNVDSTDKIAAGDSVDITFVMRDGKKVITLLSVEKFTEEEPLPAEKTTE